MGDAVGAVAATFSRGRRTDFPDFRAEYRLPVTPIATE
jgi:hypothetical protein